MGVYIPCSNRSCRDSLDFRRVKARAQASANEVVQSFAGFATK